ncbi:hypothetical protein TrVE_jg401 [Triparma verrucosa]|uniref:Uncharacterized protein n=1 Tax=Triparma verrucosa TaxID=1606542 RepID=A0A9W7CJQ3_9STRA|nr:hypothetical protein TrVE_jg401 [Triparma verrucosa]
MSEMEKAMEMTDNPMRNKSYDANEKSKQAEKDDEFTKGKVQGVIEGVNNKEQQAEEVIKRSILDGSGNVWSMAYITINWIQNFSLISLFDVAWPTSWLDMLSFLNFFAYIDITLVLPNVIIANPIGTAWISVLSSLAIHPILIFRFDNGLYRKHTPDSADLIRLQVTDDNWETFRNGLLIFLIVPVIIIGSVGIILGLEHFEIARRGVGSPVTIITFLLLSFAIMTLLYQAVNLFLKKRDYEEAPTISAKGNTVFVVLVSTLIIYHLLTCVPPALVLSEVKNAGWLSVMIYGLLAGAVFIALLASATYKIHFFKKEISDKMVKDWKFVRREDFLRSLLGFVVAPPIVIASGLVFFLDAQTYEVAVSSTYVGVAGLATIYFMYRGEWFPREDFATSIFIFIFTAISSVCLYFAVKEEQKVIFQVTAGVLAALPTIPLFCGVVFSLISFFKHPLVFVMYGVTCLSLYVCYLIYFQGGADEATTKTICLVCFSLAAATLLISSCVFGFPFTFPCAAIIVFLWCIPLYDQDPESALHLNTNLGVIHASIFVFLSGISFLITSYLIKQDRDNGRDAAKHNGLLLIFSLPLILSSVMLHYAIEGSHPTVLLVLQCIINTPTTFGLIAAMTRPLPAGKTSIDSDMEVKAKSGFGTSIILIGLFIKPFLEACFGTENGMISSISSNNFFLAVAITCVVVGFMLSFFFTAELDDEDAKFLNPVTFLLLHLGPPLIFLFWAPVITDWSPTLKLVLASLYFTIFGLSFVALTGTWANEMYGRSELKDKGLPILISLLALGISTPMLIFSVHSIHPIAKLSLQITMSLTLLLAMLRFWYKLLNGLESRQDASADTMYITLALTFFFGPILVIAAKFTTEELIPLQSLFFALQLVLASFPHFIFLWVISAIVKLSKHDSVWKALKGDDDDSDYVSAILVFWANGNLLFPTFLCQLLGASDWLQPNREIAVGSIFLSLLVWVVCYGLFVVVHKYFLRTLYSKYKTIDEEDSDKNDEEKEPTKFRVKTKILNHIRFNKNEKIVWSKIDWADTLLMRVLQQQRHYSRKKRKPIPTFSERSSYDDLSKENIHEFEKQRQKYEFNIFLFLYLISYLSGVNACVSGLAQGEDLILRIVAGFATPIWVILPLWKLWGKAKVIYNEIKIYVEKSKPANKKERREIYTERLELTCTGDTKKFNPLEDEEEMEKTDVIEANFLNQSLALALLQPYEEKFWWNKIYLLIEKALLACIALSAGATREGVWIGVGLTSAGFIFSLIARPYNEEAEDGCDILARFSTLLTMLVGALLFENRASDEDIWIQVLLFTTSLLSGLVLILAMGPGRVYKALKKWWETSKAMNKMAKDGADNITKKEVELFLKRHYRDNTTTFTENKLYTILAMYPDKVAPNLIGKEDLKKFLKDLCKLVNRRVLKSKLKKTEEEFKLESDIKEKALVAVGAVLQCSRLKILNMEDVELDYNFNEDESVSTAFEGLLRILRGCIERFKKIAEGSQYPFKQLILNETKLSKEPRLEVVYNVLFKNLKTPEIEGARISKKGLELMVDSFKVMGGVESASFIDCELEDHHTDALCDLIKYIGEGERNRDDAAAIQIQKIVRGFMARPKSDYVTQFKKTKAAKRIKKTKAAKRKLKGTLTLSKNKFTDEGLSSLLTATLKAWKEKRVITVKVDSPPRPSTEQGIPPANAHNVFFNSCFHFLTSEKQPIKCVGKIEKSSFWDQRWNQIDESESVKDKKGEIVSPLILKTIKDLVAEKSDLTQLTLENIMLEDKNLPDVFKIVDDTKKTLTEVNLEDNHLSDEGIRKLFEHVSKDKAITCRFKLDKNKGSIEGLPGRGEAKKYGLWKTLVKHTDRTEEILSCDPIVNGKSVVEERTELDKKDVDVLVAMALRNKNATEVSIVGRGLKSDSVDILSKLFKLPEDEVTTLQATVDDPNADPVDVAAAEQKVVDNKNAQELAKYLIKLDLSGNDFNDDDMEKLVRNRCKSESELEVIIKGNSGVKFESIWQGLLDMAITKVNREIISSNKQKHKQNNGGQDVLKFIGTTKHPGRNEEILNQLKSKDEDEEDSEDEVEEASENEDEES